MLYNRHVLNRWWITSSQFILITNLYKTSLPLYNIVLHQCKSFSFYFCTSSNPLSLMPHSIPTLQSSPTLIYLTADQWLLRLEPVFLQTCIHQCTPTDPSFPTSITTLPKTYHHTFAFMFAYGSTLASIKEYTLTLPPLIVYVTLDPLPSQFFGRMDTMASFELSNTEWRTLLHSPHEGHDDEKTVLMLRMKQQHLIKAVWYKCVEPCGDVPSMILPGLFLGSKSYTHLELYDIGFIVRLGKLD